MQIKAWVQASRLRTLPLASAGIFTGAGLVGFNELNILGFVLVLLTAFAFQVISNFANDLGDFQKGTDLNRTGEARMVTTGAITPVAMKKGILIASIIAIILAISALYTLNVNTTQLLVFLGLAVISVLAAVGYTMGKKAYGYLGLGDVFVFLFFGVLSVAGSFYLFSGGNWEWKILLPASAIGLLATSVLNLNNMRDWENDKASGKNTLVVKLGFTHAKTYHTLLLLTPLSLLSVYYGLDKSFGLFYFLVTPLLLKFISTVTKCHEPAKLDGELKKHALTTFFLSLIIAFGNLLF